MEDLEELVLILDFLVEEVVLVEGGAPRQLSLLRTAPKYVMKGGEDAGDPRQETMIIGDHSYKFLQGFDGLRSWKPIDGVDLALGGRNPLAGEGVAKELDF